MEIGSDSRDFVDCSGVVLGLLVAELIKVFWKRVSDVVLTVGVLSPRCNALLRLISLLSY